MHAFDPYKLLRHVDTIMASLWPIIVGTSHITYERLGGGIDQQAYGTCR